MGDPLLLQAYQELCIAKGFDEDPAQFTALQSFIRLYEDIETARQKRFRWFAKPAAPRGIYIHGGVGGGKSMLMDLFFAHAPVTKKKRLHFHEFMKHVHERIYEWRQQEKHKQAKGDPVPAIAKQIACETQLLCFDEFQVKDIADASILSRLFEGLLDEGVIVVATSNRTPQELYKGGLNRHRFLPFIDMLEARLEVVMLTAHRDYRLAKLETQTLWHTPLNAKSKSQMQEMFHTLTDGVAADFITLEVKGRQFKIQAAHMAGYTSFTDMCGGARGAEDYLVLARRFPILFLENVPQLSVDHHNEALRFITLIDILYEHRVKLIVSAACGLDDIYTQGKHKFEFQRTISRLYEMQSEDYLSQPRFRE